MRKVIKLKESDLELIVKKVLQEQSVVGAPKFGTTTDFFPKNKTQQQANAQQPTKKKNINPLGLKFGDGGIKHPDQVENVKKLQTELMKLGLLNLKSGKPSGYFGEMTKKALDLYNSQSKDGQNVAKTDQTKKLPDSGDCVGLDRKHCAMVSSTSKVNHGDAGTHECARYVSMCLSQFDQEYNTHGTGNAWKAASIASSRGQEKFNLFKTGINWENVWNGVKKAKITKKDCQEKLHKDSDKCGWFADEKSKAFCNITTDAIPKTSSVDISKLQPGDIVGLWHPSTTNRSYAFCDRMVNDLKLDDKGNFQKLPFTFNTHVGFVTAIKDGVPIIAHNVHGTYYTMPATKLLNTDGDDMLVWAYSNDKVQQGIAKKKREGQSSYRTGLDASDMPRVNVKP